MMIIMSVNTIMVPVKVKHGLKGGSVLESCSVNIEMAYASETHIDTATQVDCSESHVNSMTGAL